MGGRETRLRYGKFCPQDRLRSRLQEYPSLILYFPIPSALTPWSLALSGSLLILLALLRCFRPVRRDKDVGQESRTSRFDKGSLCRMDLVHASVLHLYRPNDLLQDLDVVLEVDKETERNGNKRERRNVPIQLSSMLSVALVFTFAPPHIDALLHVQ